MISDRIHDDIHPQNEKFEDGYPHSNVFFNFYTSKTLILGITLALSAT